MGGATVPSHLQNVSTVLMKVHLRVRSLGPSFNTTGMTVVPTLMSDKATQLKFEVQILS